MMDEPTAPGRGLPVNQPATVVVDGTCIEPPAARPSVIRLVFTPISGMVSETGLATWATADCGGATIGPVGTGSAASHGSGDPGPCPAVPPNPVETAPTGGWPAPAASSRLTISRPLAPSRTTIVCTVPAAILKRAVAVEPAPMACMVHVFAGMAW